MKYFLCSTKFWKFILNSNITLQLNTVARIFLKTCHVKLKTAYMALNIPFVDCFMLERHNGNYRHEIGHQKWCFQCFNSENLFILCMKIRLLEKIYYPSNILKCSRSYRASRENHWIQLLCTPMPYWCNVKIKDVGIRSNQRTANFNVLTLFPASQMKPSQPKSQDRTKGKSYHWDCTKYYMMSQWRKSNNFATFDDGWINTAKVQSWYCFWTFDQTRHRLN